MNELSKQQASPPRLDLLGRDRVWDDQYFAAEYGVMPQGFGVHSDDPFNLAIADLEREHGKRLNGQGRIKCMAAFRTHPEGFQRVVDGLLERARRGGLHSPLGLLVKAIDDRDHCLEPPEEADVAPEENVVDLRDYAESRAEAAG